MNIAFEFIFNLVLTILLAATVGYCWKLNRRIRIIQDSRSELAELLRHFDESTTRASESIVALQTASKKIGETIQSRIDKAQYVMDDLSFVLERAEKTADYIESGSATPRRPSAPAPRLRREEAEPEPPARNAQPQQSHAEEEEDGLSSRTMASLQAMLDKFGRGKEADTPQAKPAAPPAKPRSQAEEELLQMIRGGTKNNL